LLFLDDELFKYFQSELTSAATKEVLLENLEDLSVQYHRWLRAGTNMDTHKLDCLYRN
jgi:hypothetical protein